MRVYKRWLVQLAYTICVSMYMCYQIIHRDRFDYQTNFQALKVTVPSVSDNILFSMYNM